MAPRHVLTCALTPLPTTSSSSSSPSCIFSNHPTIHEKMHTQAMALLEIIRAREDADDGRIKSPVRNNESQVLPEEGGLGGLGLPGGGDGVAAVPDALERNLVSATVRRADFPLFLISHSLTHSLANEPFTYRASGPPTKHPLT